MAKIPHSKTKFTVLKVIQFETVTQISRSINPDVFVDNMKRNSNLKNTSSFVMQMLKRQTRVKGAVFCLHTMHFKHGYKELKKICHTAKPF